MDRTPRCGRGNSGSIPGYGIYFILFNIIDNNMKKLFIIENFFREMLLIVKNQRGGKKINKKKNEKIFMKNIKKNIKLVNKRLKKWYIFSFIKKNKMLKSKKFMLKLQKNIINHYTKNTIVL